MRYLSRTCILSGSFGGSLATSFADRYPERVKTLVLLSMVVFYPAIEGEQLLDYYLNLVAREGLKTVARRELLPFLTLHREGALFEAVRRAYDEMNEQFYLSLFIMQMHHRPIDGTHKAACPTLLLAGERDELYLPTLQSITAGYFQNGTFLVVPNAANAIFIDQPELTAQWIMDFLRKASVSERSPRTKSSLSGHLPSVIRSAVQGGAPVKPRSNPILTISLFHSFEVRLNGVPLSAGWDKRYAKNILAYLGMHASCTREELCDALFPEQHLPNALNNLRVYLGHLKKLLELPDGGSILQISGKRIGLQATVSCDLLDYAEELKRSLFIEDEYAKYEAVKALLPKIGTEPFMTGIYDQWFVDCRTDIEELIGSLSKWAAAWEARMNRPDSALYFERIADRVLDGGEAL
ncbi:alpha/beta fold hydrolase [Paenibacillus glycinis]|uniref:Alpha/beta hydrolase n=1 Tax=Paenibacillus glycinis TaxID=2697035 RepID=A0ABW9XVF0_9BACL|nr:alpha/beta hydrolase [Paenibacillus glycinis]NBD26575.1 hypothetical protein [Paenibacillus glycinis]